MSQVRSRELDIGLVSNRIAQGWRRSLDASFQIPLAAYISFGIDPGGDLGRDHAHTIALCSTALPPLSRPLNFDLASTSFVILHVNVGSAGEF